MIYGYKERRIIGAEKLRAVCIEHNWYNAGNSRDYARLLEMADKENITTDDIVEIASDIIEHSGMSVDEFNHVAFVVANAAIVFLSAKIAERRRQSPIQKRYSE